MKDVKGFLWCSVILLIAFDLPLFAAGKSDSIKAGPNTVELWSTLDETRAAYYQEMEIVRLYPEKYGKTINRSYLASTSEVRARWRMAVGAGEIPDLSGYGAGTGALGQLVRDKTVIPLDDVFKEKGWDNLFPPSIKWLWTYDNAGVMGKPGPLYGFSAEADYNAIYINEDLFKKYDIKWEPEASIAQLDAIAAAFKSRGQTPFVVGTADKWPAASLVWEIMSFYCTPNDARRYFTFDGPDSFFPRDAIIKACQKIQEWVKKGYFNSDFSGATIEDMLSIFETGNYPMLFAPNYFAVNINKAVGNRFNWDIGAFLGANMIIGGTAVSYIIPVGSRNFLDATRILDMTRDEKVIQALVDNGGVSLFIKDFNKISVKQFRNSNINMSKILAKDMLIPYLDWSNPTAFSVLGGLTSDLFNLAITPEEYYNQWRADYESFREQNF
jgi:raffinose/stachyose/melibiose transport system substrate-binding protein